MVYQMILGIVAIIFGLFAYNNAGLSDPSRTLFAAVFISMAAIIFLDNTEDTNEVGNDD